MALNIGTLTDKLIELYTFVNQATEPVLASDLAERWSDSFYSYMLEISNPAPGAGTLAGHNAGKAAMKSILEATILNPPPAGLVALTAGLTAYCLAFAGTTAPYVSFPPPSPLPPPPPTPAAIPVAALAMATTIHLWASSGTSSIPPAPPTPWL